MRYRLSILLETSGIHNRGISKLGADYSDIDTLIIVFTTLVQCIIRQWKFLSISPPETLPLFGWNHEIFPYKRYNLQLQHHNAENVYNNVNSLPKMWPGDGHGRTVLW